MKLKTKHELKAEEGESILNKWKSFFFYEEDEAASSTSNKEIRKPVRSSKLKKSETYFIVSIQSLHHLEVIFSEQKTRREKYMRRRIIEGTFKSSLVAFRRLAKRSDIYVFFYVENEEAIYNVSRLLPGKKRFEVGLINEEAEERLRERDERIKIIL